MPVREGLKTALNAMREMSVQNNSIYHQYVPIIDDNTDIGTFGSAVMQTPQVMNEFVSTLVNRIAYTQFEIKYFRNKLQVLEGDRIPLGYSGQEIYVNPAKGRKFNGEDFAGLLQKYEADVKVQYTQVNMDLQYPVTISRHQLKQAFVSWEALDTFISQISQSLYNGAYNDEYLFTKGLIAGAYKSNNAQIVKVTEPTTKELAEQFVTLARQYYLDFQEPSSDFNAWAKVGGKGRPIITLTEPENIVFIISNKFRSFLDVSVLASAFNMDKADLLGNIISVNNFDQYDDEGNKIFDGSKIVGIIADKSWFRIKRQDMFLDEFYNANNRTWQYYLNLTKMYNYSLFANGVIFATDLPQVPITSMSFEAPEGITIEAEAKEGLELTVTPANANSPTITYQSGNQSYFTVQADPDDNKKCIVTGVAEGTANLTAKAGNVETSVSVTVTPKVLASKTTVKTTTTTSTK